MKHLYLSVITGLITIIANAQTPIFSWAKTVNGNASGTDYVPKKCMTIDSNGNTYIAAYSEGAGTGGNILTIKLKANGDTLWTKLYDGPDHLEDSPVSIQQDPVSGTIYVVGNSLANATNSDIVLIAYTPQGNIVNGFPVRYDHNNQNDYATCMVLDPNTNPIIGGYSFNWINNFSNNDLLALKYNTAGVLQWEKAASLNSGDVQATAITTDNSGNVIATGTSTAGHYQGSTFFVIGFNAADGSQFGGGPSIPSSSGGVPASIKYDNGYVYVAGSVDGDITIEKFGGISLSAISGGYQVITNPNPSNSDIVHDLEIKSGNIILCGKYKNSSGNYDGVLIKYNTSLVQQFFKVIEGTNNQDDELTDLVISPSSGTPIYVTGYTDNSNAGKKGMYVAIHDFTSGDTIWTNGNYQSSLGNDRANNIVIDGYKHIYVSGAAKTLNRDIEVVKYCALYPTASAGSDVVICKGSSTTLNGSGGGSYLWSPSSGLSNNTIANPVANPTQTTNYTLVASYNGCDNSTSVTVSVNTCTDISEVDNELLITLSPNPTTSKLFIETNSSYLKQVIIYNTSGMIVMQSESNLLDVSQLPKGIYIAEVQTNSNNIMKRWVKM